LACLIPSLNRVMLLHSEVTAWLSTGPPSAPPNLDELMQSKIQSKMLVSTFLGGFTFTALFELLKDPDALLGRIDALTVLAIVALTGALGMFVAAVYIYDFLSTPLTYWRRQPEGKNEANSVVENITADTAYRCMKRAWVLVFTPAVLLATIGFLLLVARSGSVLLLMLCASIMVAAFLCWWAVRPPFGAD
jgi:hypothetical protein